MQQTGPVFFKVKLSDRGIHRRHQDQVRKRWDKDTATVDPSPASTGTSVKPTDPVPPQTLTSQKPAWEGLEPPPVEEGEPPREPPREPPSMEKSTHGTPSPAKHHSPAHLTDMRHYPLRERRPPDRLTFYRDKECGKHG